MRKYTGVEKVEVLTPSEHEGIDKVLSKTGKTSVQDLTEAERKDLPREG